MNRIVQSRTGDDGTCFRACLASILELSESQVPDFTDDDFFGETDRFLAKYGLRYRRVPMSSKPAGYSTIEGTSPRGGLHACVALDGELVWDPHPIEDGTGQGLVEPRYYGLLEKVVGAKDERHTNRSMPIKTVGGNFCSSCGRANMEHSDEELAACSSKKAKDADVFTLAEILSVLGLSEGEWRSLSEQQQKRLRDNAYKELRRRINPSKLKAKQGGAKDAMVKKVGPETCVDCKKTFMVHPYWLNITKEKHGGFVCFDCRHKRPDDTPKSSGLTWNELSGKKAKDFSRTTLGDVRTIIRGWRNFTAIELRQKLREAERLITSLPTNEQSEAYDLLEPLRREVNDVKPVGDAKTTIATINAAMKAQGFKEKLVRGNGYYYFIDGDAAKWYSSSIPTNSISNMSVNDIVRFRNKLADDYRN